MNLLGFATGEPPRNEEDFPRQWISRGILQNIVSKIFPYGNLHYFKWIFRDVSHALTL